MGDARAVGEISGSTKRPRFRTYFFGGRSAAWSFVLGGDVAVPGGECAPDASRGFAATGVGANCPGSTHGGVDIGGGGATIPPRGSTVGGVITPPWGIATGAVIVVEAIVGSLLFGSIGCDDLPR